MVCEPETVRMESRSATAPEALVRQWEPLARRVAKRFAGAAEWEDLEQIARVALWQAACRFDADRGCQFSTFAVYTIVGTLKRYVRDQAIGAGIPRRWWDLRPRLEPAAANLARRLGREPTVPELAAHLAVSEEDVAGALGVRDMLFPLSWDEISVGTEADGTIPLAERMGANDPLLESTELRLVVRQALGWLPEPLREILRRRYFDGASQYEVAEWLGISQMHVSRLERKALAFLRDELHSTLGAARV